MSGIIISPTKPKKFLVVYNEEEMEVDTKFFGGIKPTKSLKFETEDGTFIVSDVVKVGRKNKYYITNYDPKV